MLYFMYVYFRIFLLFRILLGSNDYNLLSAKRSLKNYKTEKLESAKQK